MRLKQSEIKEYREKLLKEQKSICPLCNTRIAKHEATPDRDWETTEQETVKEETM